MSNIVYNGIVTRSTGSWYDVKKEDGSSINCRIKGRFRIDGLKITNPVAVGDKVLWTLDDIEDNVGTIREILPRKNYVVRQSPRKKHFLHLLASNIDQAVLIVTIVEPGIKLGFIDRFLLMTEPYNIPVTIVFNKSDIYEDEDMVLYNYLKTVYTNIGYDVILTSNEDNTGIADFENTLKNKLTLIAGQSGVGKSTLVNTIEPSLELRTGEISDYSGKGMHTTTFAEMFDLEIGGAIIDTPGIKNLSFSHLEVMDVAHNFREFFELSVNCKFGDCTHRNEPKCAVKAALEVGAISDGRYHNYLQVLEEVEDQNYWERHSDA